MTALLLIVFTEVVFFMTMVQREYKDRLFNFIFDSEENKV